jgi:hypothetical protein
MSLSLNTVAGTGDMPVAGVYVPLAIEVAVVPLGNVTIIVSSSVRFCNSSASDSLKKLCEAPLSAIG